MTEEIDATTSSSASDVNLTSDVAALQPMTRQRIQWPGGPSIKQTFSLPESIIYYIANNPSSAEVNPILVAAQIHGDTKICSKGFEECESNDGKCCLSFDINKLASKIWLTDELLLNENTDPSYTSVLCSKLYRSEIYWLKLGDKTVFLNDFKFLASSLHHLDIKNVKIINNDESIVSIDEILEYVSELKGLSYWFNNDKSTSTIKSIAKLNDLVHLELLALFDVPEIFTVEDISSFLETNKDMPIALHFDVTVSEDFKDQLDVLIDDIIESEDRNHFIAYRGVDEEDLLIMKNRFEHLIF